MKMILDERKVCECEHLSHVNSRVGTPNGNEGHAFWSRFDPEELQPIKTALGTFKVCHRCSQDCMKAVEEVSA